MKWKEQKEIAQNVAEIFWLSGIFVIEADKDILNFSK